MPRGYKNPPKYCLCCDVLLEQSGKNRQQKYCSIQCQQDMKYREFIERWKAGEELGKKGKFQVSGHIRRYLHEQQESKCIECGWDKKNPVTGAVPLEIDHINGNWEDNSFGNLRLICPNCHSLTPTWKALNKGNGRYRKGCPNPGNLKAWE